MVSHWAPSSVYGATLIVGLILLSYLTAVAVLESKRHLGQFLAVFGVCVWAVSGLALANELQIEAALERLAAGPPFYVADPFLEVGVQLAPVLIALGVAATLWRIAQARLAPEPVWVPLQDQNAPAPRIETV